ncbi:MAG: hypothetical protein NZ934_03115 [Hadesarchaea archaeon]|nr:hypothetical protein [Hadesarchaea archaeon]
MSFTGLSSVALVGAWDQANNSFGSGFDRFVLGYADLAGPSLSLLGREGCPRGP